MSNSPERINTSTPNTRKRRQGQRMTAEERAQTQAKFLESFAKTANVRAACMDAGIDRSLVYQWAEHNDEFSLRFKQAELDANDVIRAELYRRAIEGTEKPVVSMGRVARDEEGKILMIREYSDNLLALLAKSRMPEFREKTQVDVNAQVNHQGGELARELRMLSNDQYAQFKSWVLAAKEKQG